MSETSDPANTPDVPPQPAQPESFFSKLKAAVLKVEIDALNEAHNAEFAALYAEHAAITDVEALFQRIRSKL